MSDDDPLARARDADPDASGPRGTVAVLVAVVLAIVAVTGGVAYVYHRTHTTKSDDDGPRTASVTAYFLGTSAPGQRLFSEVHTLTGVTGSDAQSAVDAALGLPDDPDYHSGFPADTRATVTTHGSYVSVDFASADVAGARPRGGDAPMAIQAIVWTVEAATGHSVPVRFSVRGRPATRLLGMSARTEYAQGPPSSTLAPVSLRIDEGDVLPWGGLVQGRVNAPRSAVVWRLRQGDRVVRHGRAVSGRSAFQLRVTAPPGNYTLEVSTDGPGRTGTSTDTKDVVIQ